MTTPFPAIAPTGRSYKLGSYPVKRFTSIAGTGVSRIYGSQPSAATLDLEFGNKGDAVALAITTAYEAARGASACSPYPRSLGRYGPGPPRTAAAGLHLALQ